MARSSIGILGFIGLALAFMVAACGGSDEPARLSLQWSAADNAPLLVAPSQTFRSLVYVRNEGGRGLDDVTLHFNQGQAGGLPFGISVGTITNATSRFEGEDQVWDLGRIGAGDTVVFPMSLWFDAESRTAEPAVVRLVIAATSPSVADEATSNVFEVSVDTTLATGR